MGGRSGNERELRRDNSTISEVRREFHEAMETGKYDICLSKLLDGVPLLCEKGRKTSSEEYEAAEAMARDGISVVLTAEYGARNATGISSKGQLKFPDGRLSRQRLSYEQRTPTKVHDKGAYVTINKALEHAKQKNVDVAVIYDKYGLFHRGDISAGIKTYECFKTNNHRFKAIIVIDKNGGVHEHGHFK